LKWEVTMHHIFYITLRHYLSRRFRHLYYQLDMSYMLQNIEPSLQLQSLLNVIVCKAWYSHFRGGKSS
jgi:hypothetical protein